MAYWLKPVLAQASENQRFQEEGALEMRVTVRDEQVRAFFTPAELARYLNVTPRTVATMLGQGVIPSYKVGGNRRIAADDLDRYLARCRQDAA